MYDPLRLYTYKSYYICNNMMCMRFDSPSHICVGWTYCSRLGGGGESLSFVYMFSRARACVYVCPRLCPCARTGDGTGDKRIGHARGIYPGRCTSVVCRTKTAPGRVLSLVDSPRHIVQYLQCLLSSYYYEYIGTYIYIYVCVCAPSTALPSSATVA